LQAEACNTAGTNLQSSLAVLTLAVFEIYSIWEGRKPNMDKKYTEMITASYQLQSASFMNSTVETCSVVLTSPKACSPSHLWQAGSGVCHFEQFHGSSL